MIRLMMQRLFSPAKASRHIVKRSNVIQFDEMGYPLRLCIMSDRDQAWIDTQEQDSDVVLKWEESQ